MPAASACTFVLATVCVLFTDVSTLATQTTDFVRSGDGLVRVRSLGNLWGRVEVRMSTNSSWYPVCLNSTRMDPVYGHKIALWLCQTRLDLNVSWAESVLKAEYVPARAPSLTCDPDYRNCSFSTPAVCNRLFHWLVYCPLSGSDDLSVRLTGGIDDSRGQLEMKMGGKWGVVCDSLTMNQNGAKVVCRQLGFGGSSPSLKSKFVITRDTAVLGDVSCYGNESRLIECAHSISGHYGCTSVPWVECGNADDFSLRLVDPLPVNASNGRLQIKLGGVYKNICGKINPAATRLACRSLGLPTTFARHLPGEVFPVSAAPYISARLLCLGTERNISECDFHPLVRWFHTCLRSSGIVCTAEPDYQLRLMGGDATSGRLEVKIGGIWGTVCDDHFNMDAARVVCRKLGFPSQAPVVEPTAKYGPGSVNKVIWLDEVTCQGTESSLQYCRHSLEGETDCQHSEDVGITCQDIGGTGLRLRLVGGADVISGRVEVSVNGQWGTVCDDGFDASAAKVVCRQLGLPYERAKVISSSSFSTATGPIFLDDVVCGGSETSLEQCSHSPLGHNDCVHDEDVAVQCREHHNVSDYTVRLQGGSSGRVGRLEVFIDGVWGTVCNDGFDTDAAAVVCRQLGYTKSNPRVDWTGSYGYVSSLTPILLDDLICYGAESSLEECSHNAVGHHDCSHAEDVAVTCQDVVDTVAITGGILGGLAAVVCLGLIICYCKKKSQSGGQSRTRPQRRAQPNHSLHYVVNLQYNNASGTLSTSSVGPGGMIVQPSAPGIFAGPPSYDHLFPDGNSGQVPLQAPATLRAPATAAQQNPGQDNPGYASSTDQGAPDSVGAHKLSDPPSYDSVIAHSK